MSKVIVIGDRSVGKTNMVYALSEEPYEKVEPKDAPEGPFAPTQKIELRNLVVIVDLPSRSIELSLAWIDTPGELQSERQKQEDNPSLWQDFCHKVQTSDYVMLLLPPHEGLSNKTNNPVDIEEHFTTARQSQNRFTEWWVPFLSKNCKKVRNILICRHKADLFLKDIDKVGNRHRYCDGFSWKNHFEFSNNSFSEINNEISQYKQNKNNSHQQVRLFVTTVHNRSLLESPWIYIATCESIKLKY